MPLLTKSVLRCAAIFAALVYSMSACDAQSHSVNGARKKVDNEYLSMTIADGWSVRHSADQRLILSRGKYKLVIDPVFQHAGPVEGGRFYEIVEDMASVDAVMKGVDQPAAGDECSDRRGRGDAIVAGHGIKLWSLYSDSSKVGRGCVFPKDRSSVWFGSAYSSGIPERKITLAYDSSDVDALPRRGSVRLRETFRDVAGMLGTLRFKKWLTATRIEPSVARPGETVTVYGSGFRALNSAVEAHFRDYYDRAMEGLTVAADGKSLSFKVPISFGVVSCPNGRTYVKGMCEILPPGNANPDDCPAGAGEFCELAIRRQRYAISVAMSGVSISTDDLFLQVSPPETSIAIQMVYPAGFVEPGTAVTVVGSGFTRTGNTIKIGSAVVGDIPSPDARTLVFIADSPEGQSVFEWSKTYKLSVQNVKGDSNQVYFSYK